MSDKLYIPILVGSLRDDRVSLLLAEWYVKQMEAYKNVEMVILDSMAMNLPQNDDGQRLKKLNPQYTEAIIKADALIVIASEYNHGYTGTLKRVLDMLYDEYLHKAVGFVGLGGSAIGGARAVEQLVLVARELGLVPIHKDIIFPKAWSLFNEAGEFVGEHNVIAMQNFIHEIMWMGQALKSARTLL